MKEGVQIELKDGREVVIDDDKDLVSLKLNGNPVFLYEIEKIVIMDELIEKWT